jgi:hypothetical protein
VGQSVVVDLFHRRGVLSREEVLLRLRELEVVWCCGVHWVAVQVYKDQIWKVRNIRLLLSLSLSLSLERACMCLVCMCVRD